MKPFIVEPRYSLSGSISPAGDKSIAHRALIISALARGTTLIKNIPSNDDCLATIKALQDFGVGITKKRVHASLTVTVRGGGGGLKQPRREIFVGESGTTLRLLAGVAAGQPFKTEFVTGKSLSHRPMARVTQPLRLMGARISGCYPPHGSTEEEYPPLIIWGGNLRAISYTLPVASAQVKSAILLAGLYARGRTIVTEPVKTRDHTERMLKAFGVPLSIRGSIISIRGEAELVSPRNIIVPGDISSAAFFIVLAAILPDARLAVRNAGLNPGRIGIIRVLKRMGARITVSARRASSTVEPAGDITVKNSTLKGVRIGCEEVPSLIDELPVLMVAACYARGQTVLEGVAELRVKETDRIRSMTENLRAMGADIRPYGAGGREIIEINGGRGLTGAAVRSFSDHRTAMSMVVAGLAASGKTSIDDVNCISKSFPDFLNVAKSLMK